MKRKLLYLVVIFCCVGTFPSAKQVYTSASKECCEICKKSGQKKSAGKEKSKTGKVASIRPFNFYLFNI